MNFFYWLHWDVNDAVQGVVNERGRKQYATVSLPLHVSVRSEKSLAITCVTRRFASCAVSFFVTVTEFQSSYMNTFNNYLQLHNVTTEYVRALC